MFVGLACLIGVPVWAQDACEGAATRPGFECAAGVERRTQGTGLAAARQYDPWPEGRAEPTMRAVQRAGVAVRDAACEAEAAPAAGGSIQPMLRATCRERLTLLRTFDLSAYAEN